MAINIVDTLKLARETKKRVTIGERLQHPADLRDVGR